MYAEKARSLLGPDVWSEVIEIKNAAPSRSHPSRVYATVFEVSSALWIYMPAEGTQSLSRFFGQAGKDRGELLPLVKGIYAGFEHLDVVASGSVIPARYDGSLENGCFIESLALLRERSLAGQAAVQPRLLIFYREENSHIYGHTVLTFYDQGRVWVVDPAFGRKPQRFTAASADTPIRLAEAVSLGTVSSARWLPVDGRALVRTSVSGGLARSDAATSGAGRVVVPL